VADLEKELNAFPRTVRQRLAEVISEHDIRYRVTSDNSHLLLYADDGSRPFKVSASRMAERSLRYLDRWVAARWSSPQVVHTSEEP
jgi:hypothetical protein